MNTAHKLHVAHPFTNEPIPAPNTLQGSLEGRVARWFLPRKETRLMSEEATRTGGLWMPYPLLAIVMGLVLALGGGIIGLYAQLSAMQTAMLLRDNDYERQLVDQKKNIELLQMYINDDRRQLAVLQDRADKLTKH